MKLSEHLAAVSFVRSPVPVVDDLFRATDAKYGEVVRRTFHDYESAASFLSPLLSFGTRHLLVALGPWTLLLNNKYGPAASAYTVFASEHAATLGVNATWREDGRLWEVYDHGQVRRAVVCYADGERWVFHQEGEPFPFEDTSVYSHRKKRERFPVSTIQRYVHELTGLGFPVDWRSMLSTPIVGLERSTQRFRSAPEQFPLELDL